MLFLFSVEVYHYSVSYESNWGLTITTWNDTADLVNETPRKTTCTSFFGTLVTFAPKRAINLDGHEYGRKNFINVKCYRKYLLFIETDINGHYGYEFCITDEFYLELKAPFLEYLKAYRS